MVGAYETRARAVLLFAGAFVLGCTGDARTEDNAQSAGGSATNPSSGSTSSPSGGSSGAVTTTGGSGTTGATEETDETSDAGIVLDVQSAETGMVGGCEDEECTCSSVDVLFVIDNSGSMCSYQEQLAAAFPGFVDAMFDALPLGTDLHVGITTSGFELGGSHSENNCVATESQPMIDQFYVRPSEGMVAGNGLQGRLLEWSGQRYFTADTSNAAHRLALSNWFSGAASSVGCGVSSFEFNAGGAAWALHPDNAATNDGFLRDEGAVLVLFILSDEADQSLDVETLSFLHDTVTTAKQACGGDACVVTGGLLSEFCTDATNASDQFLSSFGPIDARGSIGSPFMVPDYSTVVGNTFASVVAETCDDIVPEG